MQTLKKSPHKAKVTAITPQYLTQRDAARYISMSLNTLKDAARQHGLDVYAYGRNKIYYKVQQLDKMMESFLIIDNGN